MNAANARILIVDDTQQNIQVLGTILREGGYQLNVAQDGQQALDSVAKVVPDLILLDIMMPVMDGFETCKSLKADPATADIPVIFLTAKTEAEDIVQGFELGAVDYVTKPFNAAELFVRVDTHLARSRLQREVETQLREIEGLKTEQEFFVRNELKNRIDPIVESLTRLHGEGLQNITEVQRNNLVLIAEGVEGIAELLRLLEKLQDFQKGTYDPSMAEIDLDATIRRAVSDLELTFGPLASIAYGNNLANSALQADGDLLAAAIGGLTKHSVEQVAGHTDTAAREVRVELSESEGGVAITVQHGKGAAASGQDIGAFFEQLESDSGHGGSPALTHAILVARAHQGTLTVEEEDAWTTYRVQIPR